MTNEAEQPKCLICKKSVDTRLLGNVVAVHFSCRDFLAARAASPVSAPTFPDCNIGIAHECCVARMKRLEKEGYGVKWVAPVSAEHPTTHFFEPKFPAATPEDWVELRKRAAPSVASEDSTKKPLGTCDASKFPHRIGGGHELADHDPPGCYNWKSVAEDSATQPASTTISSGMVAYESMMGITHQIPPEQPSSEDWMRKAAKRIRAYFGPKAEFHLDAVVEIISEELAASQLSAEKKSVGLRQAPEGKQIAR